MGYRPVIEHQVSFILQGLLMATFGITGISAPVELVVGPLFAVTGLTYLVYTYHYRKEM